MSRNTIPVPLLAMFPLLMVAAPHAAGQVDPPDQNTVEGLRQFDLNLPEAALLGKPMLPEGSFIAGQEGTLVRTPSGDRLFVYLPDGAHKPIALLMVPCLELERLEKAAADSQVEAPLFLLTGQILAYHRRNYLLPSAWTQLRAPKAEDETNPAENPDPAQTVPADDDEIADLIRELEQSRNDPRALLRRGDRLWLAPRQASETDEERPEGPSDGSLISRRTGRFVRQGVVWIIAFDNDSESETKDDVPLIVLPSLNHEKLERLAGRRGDEFRVEISGRVFQYKGRHYLLPSVFQVVPESDVRPIG